MHAGQAIFGSKEFVERVKSRIGKERQLGDVTARNLYRKPIRLEDLHLEVCRFYGVKELTKGKSEGYSRDMFIYLAKRETAATNREIGKMAGKISFSAVTHQHVRRLKRLEKDIRAMKEWVKEAGEIMSKVKG